MTDIETMRERHEPLDEIHIGMADDGSEWLWIGHITGSSIYRQADGKRYHLKRLPITPQSVVELATWIQNGPEKLDQQMDADIPEDIGETVGITEFYSEIDP